MTTVRTCENRTEWDEELLTREAHPLQLWGWGETKAAHNWQVDRVFIYDDDHIIGAAQLLIRPLPRPLTALVYVPRGPVCDAPNREAVLEALADYAKQTHKAVAITVEPDWEVMPPVEGWQPSTNTILIPRTLILDLTKSEDELLGAMTKKTRQYVRKSAKEDMTIRKVRNREELAACLAIYKQTADRAGFTLHDDQYYYDIFDKMGDHSLVTVAIHNNQPVAFLWLSISATTAFELYGGMNDDGQRLRANYALKWHTIQLARKWGIERYDLNGLLNDGVSTFKQGFASHEDMLAGTYDKPLSPLYIVWDKALPLAKKVIRTIKNR
ncbi:MAG TPA: peptidoglycan bridge formation glycyltransferase FemA/FemB family protein [Candidatus Saccharimonadales bacterium]|nr:peptidoglycan bridge formation glycyltransferase FemA/FemB family protein [Candidatus Saccharimonadales bacterium]